jgi:hypothetical protein
MCCGVIMVDKNVHKYSSDKAVTTDDYARCKRKIKKSHLLYRLNVNKIDMAPQSQSCSHHTGHGSV